VYDPEQVSREAIEAKLHSFFPEADRYGACHRLAVPGPFEQAIRQHLEGWPVDLIVAPGSETVGWPRIGARSTRARLIEQCGVPVWTIGGEVALDLLLRPVRNVGCWVDYDSFRADHLEFAIEYANKLHAKLHLLRALPAIDENLLSTGSADSVLAGKTAAREIVRVCASALVVPEVHVSRGPRAANLARMLSECDADVVFLSNAASGMVGEWMGMGMRLSDGLPCPAVCLGETLRGPVWSLETGQATRVSRTAPISVSVRATSDVSQVGTRA